MITAEDVSAIAAVCGLFVPLVLAFLSERKNESAGQWQRVLKHQEACRLLDDPQTHPLVRSRVCAALVGGRGMSEQGGLLLVPLGDSKTIDLYSKTGGYVQVNADGSRFVMAPPLGIRWVRLLFCMGCLFGAIGFAGMGIVPLAMFVDGHMAKPVPWLALLLMNAGTGTVSYMTYVTFLRLGMADSFFEKMRTLGLAEDGAAEQSSLPDGSKEDLAGSSPI